MYKVILDMVYRYNEEGGLQLVGILSAGQSVESFLSINKGAFL